MRGLHTEWASPGPKGTPLSHFQITFDRRSVPLPDARARRRTCRSRARQSHRTRASTSAEPVGAEIRMRRM
eukprot:2104081-Pleurochrysis_carterae.AAC.1